MQRFSFYEVSDVEFKEVILWINGILDMLKEYDWSVVRTYEGEVEECTTIEIMNPGTLRNRGWRSWHVYHVHVS